MVVADAATVAFAEALDLSKTTAPGRDLFATFTLEPDVREHARIDGDQATVCSDVSSTENLGSAAGDTSGNPGLVTTCTL